MARIEELPEGLKVADMFKGAEGVGGLVTMLVVGHLQPSVHLRGRSLRVGGQLSPEVSLTWQPNPPILTLAKAYLWCSP